MTLDTRLGARRASLRTALREGDPLAASRAGSRLRVRGADLTLDELASARAARARLGHAIREARWRRRLAEPSSVERVGRTTPQPRRWRMHWVSNAVAGLATIALLAVVLIPRPASQEPAPAAAPELVPPVQVVEARIGGRGRTTAAVALVAEPEPTPAPTADPSPTAAPTAPHTPAPVSRSAPRVAAPSATPGGAPSGAPGGVPGGSPGGVPGGQPGGTGVAIPIPTPNRAPLFSTPPPTGYDRITFHVTNGVNGEPLQDVCIVLGTGDCKPARPHTNALGLWWMDLPRDAAMFWDARFILDRFTTGRTFVTYRPGADLTVEIKLYQIR